MALIKLIDDEPKWRQFVETTLTRNGHTLTNGEAGLYLVSSLHLEQIVPQKTIVFTSTPKINEGVTAYRLGAVSYLSKDFSVDKLMKNIDFHLGY